MYRKKNYLKLLVLLLLVISPIVKVSALETTSYANIIVYVDFKDTDHTSHNGYCFFNNENETFKYFNGTDGTNVYERGLKPYLNKISYGTFQVQNIFPQYNGTNIISITMSGNREDYLESSTNVSDKFTDSLVTEVINYLNSTGTLLNNTLDYDNDGVVDNLSIVVADGIDESGTRKGGNSYKTNYQGESVTLNGKDGLKYVSNYIVLKEYTVYGGSKSGVIIHEFLHTLGYPDLYRSSSEGGLPVGSFDIMSGSTSYPSYPLAYFRSKNSQTATNWFSIPTVTKTEENYSLTAVSRTTNETKDNQAVILKTGYSDSEFFVLEYRKKETEESLYDQNIYGSGLIIYRVNTLATQNNITNNPDIVYVFRPNDSRCSNGKECGSLDMTESFLSLESKRVSYGTGDLTASLNDGAITYSDGTNSGIVISNVGSTSGDTITFDISFLSESETDYWNNVSSKEEGYIKYMDSYLDTDGSMYYLINNTNKTSLYKYDTKGFTQVGDSITNNGLEYKIIKYNDSFYIAYNALINSKYYTKLLKLNNTTWQEVYTFPNAHSGNYMDVTSDKTGIYFAIPSEDDKLYGYKYTDTVTNLGEITSGTFSNTNITSENGVVAIKYRDYTNNKITVKVYQNNAWVELSSTLKATYAKIKINNNKIYMVKNGESITDKISYVYVYDLNQNDGWKQLGNSAYATDNASEIDITFYKNNPYIVYQGSSNPEVIAMYLKDDEWVKLGSTVATVGINYLKAFVYNDTIYVNYVDSTSNTVKTKSHEVMKVDTSLEDNKEEKNIINIKYKILKLSTSSSIGKLSGTIDKLDENNFLNNIEVSDNLESVVFKTSNQYVGTSSKVIIRNKSTKDIINEYVYILYGDTNGDGIINSGDLFYLRKHLLGQELKDEFKEAADVNSDKTINSGDLFYVRKILLSQK